MARHWLPVQGFDEDLADRVFGVSVGKFEVMSNAEEVEEDPTDPPPALKKATTTPQKRQAAPQKPSPRKKNPVAANAAISSGEPTMAKNKERKEPTIKPNPKVTTTTPEEGRAPTAPESGMNKKGETTPTRIIKPDPDQGTTTPTPTSKKKQEKKTNPKASVAAEEMSTPSPKSSKAKTSNVPMPTSWAEAGVADRMLVTMRDNGDDWAKIRKQWKELTGLDTAASTLPTRYSRLKARMTVLEDGD
ncbi:hypothetical protein MMC31_003745, partial [Peltigera leucophlebia]|nr:hypothetical protein [Peltigera leucophlebia]